MDTAGAVEATDESRDARTLILGTRLALAANTMMQLAFVFAYLYLRGNNFNGGWRPDGLSLGGVAIAITLLLQLACLGSAVAALSTARRGGNARAIAAIALVMGIASVAVRWWYQYHLGDGFVINNGTYAATTMVWFGVLLAEALLGAIWLLAIVAAGPRTRDPEHASHHLRAFSEYWAYLLVLSTLVWLLARLV